MVSVREQNEQQRTQQSKYHEDDERYFEHVDEQSRPADDPAHQLAPEPLLGCRGVPG
jgi:hypothetical protein